MRRPTIPYARITRLLALILFLALFFYVCWPYTAEPGTMLEDGWPSHYADDMARKEKGEAELFLIIDPLVAISTAIAARTWVWSLTFAGIILGTGLLVPRGFCGYLCPLGTVIDFFDWLAGTRVEYFNLKRSGWWRNLKYYLLAGILIGSLSGVLLAGFVAAMPVITRGVQFMVAPIQTGLLRGWHQVPTPDAGQYLSIGLFILILMLGLLGRRFWCRYVCPTGAVFSIASLVLRLTERKVENSCIDCSKCVEACPFDAIRADYTTRTMDCTFCRTCGGVCPTHSIKFVGRWHMRDLKPESKPLMREESASRRGFLVAAASGLASALLIRRVFNAGLYSAGMLKLPLRPPGSVPERDFLALCIRCGECYKVCPNNALQPLGFQRGLEGVWTPYVAANWSGCEPSCNNCGQVCPTGAIRAISLAEKRSACIGLAVVDKSACLPWAEKDACRLCADECSAAGYHAIEFERVDVQLDEDGFPVEGSGFAAPVILPEKCVGCGLCQSVCFRINKKVKSRLRDTAVRIISRQTS